MEDMTTSQNTFSKASYVEFPKLEDKGIENMDYNRVYNRTNVTQQTLIEGQNKAIILNNGVSHRILIGYQKDGF